MFISLFEAYFRHSGPNFDHVFTTRPCFSFLLEAEGLAVHSSTSIQFRSLKCSGPRCARRAGRWLCLRGLLFISTATIAIAWRPPWYVWFVRGVCASVSPLPFDHAPIGGGESRWKLFLRMRHLAFVDFFFFLFSFFIFCLFQRAGVVGAGSIVRSGAPQSSLSHTPPLRSWRRVQGDFCRSKRSEVPF